MWLSLYACSNYSTVYKTYIAIDLIENENNFTYIPIEVCHGKRTSLYSVKCDKTCLPDPQNTNQWLTCNYWISFSNIVYFKMIIIIVLMAILINWFK